MARTSKLVWLVAGALVVASCGGGDDADSDLGPAPPDAGTSAESDSSDDGSTAVDEPSSELGSDDGATGTGDGTGATSDLGPALEPIATFPLPASAAPDHIAVSPNGDRVAVMAISETDFATTLTVYDAGTGDELVSIVDDRLDGDLFWTGDDRIVTVGGFGETRVWDSATLAAASDAPLAEQMGCNGGNGTVFDPIAEAVFLKSDALCRIDLVTGEVLEDAPEQRTTLLAVAIGGNEVYLRTTDSSGALVLRVLDASTLAVVSDEPSDGPNPVVAASGNGTIEQESGGFGYLVQPAGRIVDFDTAGITTSAAGGYYVSGFGGGKVVISTADGSTIGSIRDSVVETAWSADDTVLVARTPDGVSVYAIG